MNFVRNCFPENFLEDLDQNLQIFYNEVLGKELDLSDPVSVLKIKKALKEVVYAYKKETVESLSSNILFDSSEKRYSYILKHCPCFTSAVSRHFLRLLHSNPYLLYHAIQNQELNLCCLGGGPATDAVAIAKIINGLNSSAYGYKNKLHLRVTVVDLSEEWKTTAHKVLQTLQDTPEFCDAHRMKVSFEFLKADLTEQWDDHLTNVLRDADIVTMVYFVSAVHGSAPKSKCCLMLENIMHALKPGALLFFLDSAKELHSRSVCSTANSMKNLRQIYGPHLQEFHTISMKSIKKFIELYSKQFNISACLTNCFVSSAGWTKEQATMSVGDGLRSYVCRSPLRDISNTSGLTYPVMNRGKNACRKMMTYNTRRQECFRQKINNLFFSEILMDFDSDDADDLENFIETDCWECDGKILYASKSKGKRIFTKEDHKALCREK